MVEGRINQCLEDELCHRHQGTDHRLGNWLPPKSVRIMIYLPVIAGGETGWLVDGVKYLLCSVLLLRSLKCSLRMIRPGSIWSHRLCGSYSCSGVSISVALRSTYPDVLSNNEVPLKSMLCSATADFSGWCRHMYLWCSLLLGLLALPVCPTYTFPHSHEIYYTSGIFSYNSSYTFFSCGIESCCHSVKSSKLSLPSSYSFPLNSQNARHCLARFCSTEIMCFK